MKQGLFYGRISLNCSHCPLCNTDCFLRAFEAGGCLLVCLYSSPLRVELNIILAPSSKDVQDLAYLHCHLLSSSATISVLALLEEPLTSYLPASTLPTKIMLINLKSGHVWFRSLSKKEPGS